MNLIADKDGVDVIISPVNGMDGFQANIDFNVATKLLNDLDNLEKDYDIKLMDGFHHVGTAKFSAFQFIADGVVRRTIALKNLTVEPAHRGQKKSYDVMQFVVDTVQRDCDRDWGPVYGDTVVFIEKKDMHDVPEKDRNAVFSFLKKIGERVLGLDPKNQPAGGDLAVSIIGEAISIGLIEGHLMRSNSVEAAQRNHGK